MSGDQSILLTALFGGGLVLTGAGLWIALARGREHAPAGGASEARPDGAGAITGRTVAILLVILAVAFALRIEGLDRRGMTHIEIYVPGIALPAGISRPPPRISFSEVLDFHFHDEPHPQGFYFFSWALTRVFGTSLWALRFPSVVLGVGSVLLTFWIASRPFGRFTALVAAVLVALNGHQIHWSQVARMYVLSCFLGLLATWAFVELLRRERRSPIRELGYVAGIWSCCFTQLFGWMLLAGHVVAALRYARTRSGALPRVIELQGIAAMLGAPLVAHVIYRTRPSPFLEASAAEFFRDYFNFGFLFEPDLLSLPERTAPWFVAVILTACSFGCLLLAARSSRSTRAAVLGASCAEARPIRWLEPLAIGVTLLVLGLASIAHQRRGVMALAAILPLAVVAALAACRRIWPAVERARLALDRRAIMSESLGIFVILAFVPIALLLAAHALKPILTSRGAMIFTPYLLVALAAGFASLSGRRAVLVALGAVLLAAHAGSILYYRAMPAPNDHQSLAAQMTREFREGDLVFVPPRDWVTTPLFYHLQNDFGRLVAADYDAAVAAHPGARVWVPLYSDMPPRREIAEALAGRRVGKELTALRARAILYVP